MSGSQLFFAPCSKEGEASPYQHLKQTVLSPVPRSEYTVHTDEDFGTAVSIWGASEGTQSTWEALEKGDTLLFYVGDRLYRYAATVIDKEENLELGKSLWADHEDTSLGGDDPQEPWRYIIYLDQPIEVEIDGEEVHGFAGHEIDYSVRFFRVNDQGHQKIRDKFGSVDEYLRARRVDGDTAPTSDSEEDELITEHHSPNDVSPPERTQTTVDRVKRDSEMVEDLKEDYKYCCQVCGQQRQQGKSGLYAEGHHLHPLGDEPPGPDVEENVVVLCPNHHADFDYGAIRIDPESLELEHLYEDEVDGETLDVRSDHDLARRHVDYHNLRAAPEFDGE